MPVVAIINQKGGTGKTTLSTNLAWAFAESSSVLCWTPIPKAAPRIGPAAKPSPF